jgi:hypothetical protein
MTKTATHPLLAVAVAATAASLAHAHSDVLVRYDAASNTTLVGAAEDIDAAEGGPFFDLETRVFEGVFINPAVATPPFGFAFERDEPGFYNGPEVTIGDNLPGSADLTLVEEAFALASGFDTTFFWNGSGSVDFQPLSIAQPGVDLTFSPAVFAATDANGNVDDHPLFGLTGPALDGVYLSRTTLSVGGAAPSEPFYFVWLASSVLTSDLDAEELEELLEAYEEGGPAPVFGGVDFSFYEEAVEFAEGIPEPSSAVLAALAMFGLARRVRA